MRWRSWTSRTRATTTRYYNTSPFIAIETRPSTIPQFKSIYSQRFLFIHDTLYVDGCPIDSPADPTRAIRAFLKRKREKGISAHHAVPMGEVRVRDLTLRLGQPYLFQHVGSCEHLVVFSDLRLLNAGDVQEAEKYPLKVMDARAEAICLVCRRLMAR